MPLAQLEREYPKENDLSYTNLRESAVADDLGRFCDLLRRAGAHPRLRKIFVHDIFLCRLLLTACFAGSFNVIRYLVETRKTPVPEEALDVAASKDAELLRFLIAHSHSFQVDKARDSRHCFGFTLLHVACRHEQLEVVRCLVEEHGANVLSTDSFGATPLHCAADDGNLELVKCLVENSPAESFNVDMVNANGETPLHESCRSGHLEVVQYLVQDCNAKTQMKCWEGGTSLLHCAVESNNLDMVQYVMESCNGSSFVRSKTSGYGQTPLHEAVESGYAEIARYLVQHGANVHEGDSEGMAALHVALQPDQWRLFGV